MMVDGAAGRRGGPHHAYSSESTPQLFFPSCIIEVRQMKKRSAASRSYSLKDLEMRNLEYLLVNSETIFGPDFSDWRQDFYLSLSSTAAPPMPPRKKRKIASSSSTGMFTSCQHQTEEEEDVRVTEERREDEQHMEHLFQQSLSREQCTFQTLRDFVAWGSYRGEAGAAFGGPVRLDSTPESRQNFIRAKLTTKLADFIDVCCPRLKCVLFILLPTEGSDAGTIYSNAGSGHQQISAFSILMRSSNRRYLPPPLPSPASPKPTLDAGGLENDDCQPGEPSSYSALFNHLIAQLNSAQHGFLSEADAKTTGCTMVKKLANAIFALDGHGDRLRAVRRSLPSSLNQLIGATMEEVKFNKWRAKKQQRPQLNADKLQKCVFLLSAALRHVVDCRVKGDILPLMRF